MNDVLNDALSNLEHDNYERSHKGYENRQADIALIRAAQLIKAEQELEAHRAEFAVKERQLLDKIESLRALPHLGVYRD